MDPFGINNTKIISVIHADKLDCFGTRLKIRLSIKTLICPVESEDAHIRCFDGELEIIRSECGISLHIFLAGKPDRNGRLQAPEPLVHFCRIEMLRVLRKVIVMALLFL